jgi:chromate transporter
MNAVALYWLLLRAVLLSFSGFATVPLLRDSLVLDHALLTDTQLNDAIAISQVSPGPLGIYVVIVGYFVCGAPGAVAGVLALITPAFLAIPLAALVRRGQSPLLQGASRGVLVASCAMMLVTGVHLAPTAAPSTLLLLVVAAGTALLALTNITPIVVIAAAAVIGLMAG